jgi:hypothetical protein
MYVHPSTRFKKKSENILNWGGAHLEKSPKRHPLVRNCLHLVALIGAAQAIGLGQAGKPFTGSPDPRGRGVFGVSGK